MADTAVVEAAQAYFCAIVDFLGANTDASKKLASVNTYKDFKTFWSWHKQAGKTELKKLFAEHVESGVASFEAVEKLLNSDQSWYKSSRNIAIKLIQGVKTEKNLTPFKNIADVGWKKIFYAHQDKLIMNQIAKLFQIVTANHKNPPPKEKGKTGWGPPFSDINKWSPADIYFATQDGVDKLKTATSVAGEKAWSYTQLNEFMYDLWKGGHLLPVSLKKAGDNVHLKYMNFEAGWTERVNAYTISEAKVQEKKTDNDKDEYERQFKFTFNVSDGSHYRLAFASKCSYPIRDALLGRGLGDVKTKIEIAPVHGNAREGQVGPTAILKIRGLSKELITIIENAEKKRTNFKNTSQVTKLIEKRQKEIKNESAAGVYKLSKDKKKVEWNATHKGFNAAKENEKKFKIELAKLLNDVNIGYERDLITNTSKYFTGRMTDAKKNDLRLLFMYAAARSQDSAKYIIAK